MLQSSGIKSPAICLTGLQAYNLYSTFATQKASALQKAASKAIEISIVSMIVTNSLIWAYFSFFHELFIVKNKNKRSR